jgi:hypothetical protein
LVGPCTRQSWWLRLLDKAVFLLLRLSLPLLLQGQRNRPRCLHCQLCMWMPLVMHTAAAAAAAAAAGHFSTVSCSSCSGHWCASRGSSSHKHSRLLAFLL